jgi:Trk-type K+ transport system membrane component
MNLYSPHRPLLRPVQFIVLSFAGTILVGALLLWLPDFTRQVQVSFVDALFTSASAVCVTGLSVVDTGTGFSLWGQLIILGLIQVGGLGPITFNERRGRSRPQAYRLRPASRKARSRVFQVSSAAASGS